MNIINYKVIIMFKEIYEKKYTHINWPVQALVFKI